MPFKSRRRSTKIDDFLKGRIERLIKVISDDVYISVRFINVLDKHGINDFAYFTDKTERDVLKMKYVGRKGLYELRGIMKCLNLEFKK